MSEAEARSVVVERRIRQDNIVPFKGKDGKLVTAEEQAADPRRGYTLGLMLIDGSITKEQHDAGVRYAEDMARYHGLTGVPFPSARAQNLFAVRGHDGEENQDKADAASRARRRAHLLRDELLSVGNIDNGRKVEHAVKEVAFLDNEYARKWPAHMIDFARRGLNALTFHYGIVDAKKGA